MRMSPALRGAAASLLSAAVLLSGGAAQAAAGDTIPATVQKGVNFLTTDVVSFSQSNSCQACHRQGAALYGIAASKSSGYTINESATNGVGFLAQHAANDQYPDGGWIHERWYHPVSKTSYSFFGLAGFDKHVSTKFSQRVVNAANWAIARQTSAGHWNEDHGSFPTTYGNVPVTARMMVGIAQAKARVTTATAATFQARLDLAANWLRANKNNQSGGVMAYAFQIGYALLGLKAAGLADDHPDVVFLRDRLLSTISTPMGRGWGYSQGHMADGFNTGIALYALKQVGAQLRDYPVMRDAVLWLRDSQVNHSWGGYWNASGMHYDIPTTFAILGLSPWGDLGVNIAADGKTRQVIDAWAAESQTATYALKITNEGAFDRVDTYTLSIQGGLPGWDAQVSPLTLTLASGQSGQATLTVTAPPNLPEALPADVTVIATSKANPSIASSVILTTYTNPPPPVTGRDTATTFVAGPSATVSSRLEGQRLAASVRNTWNNTTIAGPGQGVVTFYVAGIPVGTDSDADGNGVYEISWVPGFAWSHTGPQDLRAIYSGIDKPSGDDLLPSLIAGTITISTPPDGDKDGIPDELEPGVGTDPANPDSDGDSLTDGREYNELDTDPTDADTDDDGLSDGQEIGTVGTDPLNGDSDGDGYLDGEELASGADPKNPGSLPLPPPQIEFPRNPGGAVFEPTDGDASTDTLSFDLEGSCGEGVPCLVQVFDNGTLIDSFEATGFWMRHYTLPLGTHEITVTASNRSGSDSSSFEISGTPNAPTVAGGTSDNAVVTTDPSWTLETIPGGEVDVTLQYPGQAETSAGTFVADDNGQVVVDIELPADGAPVVRFYPRVPGEEEQGDASATQIFVDTTAPAVTHALVDVAGTWSEGETTLSVESNDATSAVPGNALTYEWVITGPEGTTTFVGGPEHNQWFGPGDYTVSVTITDSAGNSSVSISTLHVEKRKTVCELEGVSASYGDTFTRVGNIFDTSTGILTVKPLLYTAAGISEASLEGYRVLLAPGSYELTATFEGDDLYFGCSVSAPLEVASTDGKITGGGSLDKQRTFELSAQKKVVGRSKEMLQGNVSYVDRANGISLKSTAVTGIGSAFPYAGIVGTATVNGVDGYTFVVDVIDGGSPGRNDQLRIRISGHGLSYDSRSFVEGGLAGGNLTIH